MKPIGTKVYYTGDMANHDGFFTVKPLDLVCLVIMRQGGHDVRCNKPAISEGRCKRHGGTQPTDELITHRPAVSSLDLSRHGK